MTSQVYKIDTRVTLEADGLDGGGIMFDSFTASICTCNETAWVILETLQNGANLEQLSKRLVDVYDVDNSTAQSDVILLLKELSAMDLVHEQS